MPFRSVRRSYQFATIALLSSRALPFSPLRRLPARARFTLTNCAGKSRMTKTDSSCVQDDADIDTVILSTNEILVFHLKQQQPVNSTQEEAKRLLGEHRRQGQAVDKKPRALAVIADRQERGRGTSGRSWVASTGNLYLTCAIPMDLIPLSKVTLLPLGVGVLVAEQLAKHTDTRPTVKWPNDVLLDGLKIAGTLIENHRVDGRDWWLVGIGVNVESHPMKLLPEENDSNTKPRSATCLRDHAKGSTNPTAVNIGVSLALDLVEWTQKIQAANSSWVAYRWRSWADMGTTYTIRETGETVMTLDIEPDGQLRVLGQDGTERLLVADYLH